MPWSMPTARRILTAALRPRRPRQVTLGVTRLEDRIQPSGEPVFFLHGGGANDLTYRGPVVVADLDVPAFSAAAVGAAGSEAAMLNQVAAVLTAESAGTVTYTTTRPAAGPYSTIFVGGGDGRFALWGRFFGLAEANDPGNARPDDRAWVFPDTIAEALAEPSPAALTAALTDVVRHEGDRLRGRVAPGEGDGLLDAVAAQGPSHFQYPIVPAGGDGRSGAVVTQHFGQGFGTVRGHLGTDFRGSTGTPVYAIADGKVTEVKDVGGGWGKVVIVEHKTTQWGWDKDVYSMYAHVDGFVVSKGQQVRRGQKLCVVGPVAAGSTAPHLHLEIRSGIRAWWQPGPGYKGNDFNRLSSPTVTRSDYPDLKWHDPEKLIRENLYPVEVWASNSTPSPGQPLTLTTRIPVSALPRDGNGNLVLTNVGATLSVPGLSTQSVTIQAASPDVNRGQSVAVTSDGYLAMSGQLPVTANASSGASGTPRATYAIANGTPTHAAASAPVRVRATYSDPVATFNTRFGMAPSWLRDYAASLHPDLLNPSNVAVRDQIMKWLAERALWVNDALPSASPSTPEEVFAAGLSAALGDRVVLHGDWDKTKPTVIAVHGVSTTDEFHQDVGLRLEAGMTDHANVITFYWGQTRKENGYDRTLAGLINVWGEEEQFNIRGAVDLHLLVKLLNRTYGSSAASRVNIIAHSQGTVVTTAALSLHAENEDYFLNQLVFIGANIHDAAGSTEQEFSCIPASRLKITNFTSESDEVVGIGPGQGGGEKGFVNIDPDLPGTVVNQVVSPNQLRLPDRSNTVEITINHVGEAFSNKFEGARLVLPEPNDPDQTALSGWWDWIIVKEENEDTLLRLIGGNPTAVAVAQLHGSAGEAYHSGPSDPDEPTAVYTRSPLVASLGTDIALGGVQYVSTSPRPGRTQVAPTLTRVDLRSASVLRGELVVATAIGAADADGRVVRLEGFLDDDGNAHPDAGELVAVDYNPDGGFRATVATRDLAPGTYTLVFRVVDDEGNVSELVTATFQVIDPAAPPPQLPAGLPPATKPNFGIVPHRNGDVAYSEENYTLTRHRPDIWQLTLATGGGVTVRTTGSTDTVLGVYDAATGQLLAFDEDNGSGSNAELTRTLLGGTTYLFVVAAQHGSFGAYGLEVTGPNQVVAATLAPAAPLHTASAANTVAFSNDVKYFAVTAPAGATRMGVVLDVAGILDGFVRVENAAHETVATAFLAGTGADDRLADVPVVAGQTYYVTVTGMYGSAGAFDLRVDFDPDARTLPDEIVPVPVAALRQVVTPPGGVLEHDATLASAGEFHYYLLTPAQTGEFVFDVSGDFDAQAGLYFYNGAANATLLASDDDGGGAGNPRLVHTLTGGNQYLLVVRADGPTAGDYRLRVQQAVRDAFGRIQLFGLESVGSRSGSYASNARYAHYQFDTPVNATTMTVRLTLLPNLANLDATLRVTDATGTVIGVANAAGRGGAEQLVGLTARPGETYTVTVYGNEVTAGDYVIDVDVDPNFTPSGGTEFSVAEGFGDQSYAGVGRNAAGQTVAAWLNFGSTRELRFQRYAANGQPAGGVVTVNTTGEPSGRPGVAVAVDGSFAVVWGRGNDIYLRKYDAAGDPTTGEVLVGPAGVLSGEPRVAVAPNGSFVVVWTSFNNGDPDGGIYARLVSTAGAVVGSVVHVNTTTARYQGGPAVAFRPDGSFLVIWHSDTGSELALLGRRFTAGGSAAGAEFRINGPGRALYPSLAVAPDGATVVTWKNHTGSGVESIRARRLAADDTLLGSEITVSQGLTPLDFEADVAFGADGQFVVAWTTSVETDGSGIAAQAFRADGSRTGPEYLLNQQRAHPQTRAVLAGTGSDTVFAVWQSNPGGSVAENLRGLAFTLGPPRQPILRVTDSRGTADDHFIDFGRFASPVAGTTQTITIHNDGNAALEVTGLELYGAGAASFTVAGPTTFSIPPGDSRGVTLTYSSTTGAAFAGLRFGHNNPHEGSVGWVNLLGEVAKPTFEVGFTDANAVEGAGAGVVFVRVARVNADTGAAVTVNLTSAAPGRVSVPATAVIPAGQDAVDVPVTVLDNDVPGDTATVTVTVTAAAFVTGSDGLEVIDNEPGGVLVRATGSGTAVVEGGATDTYTLLLTARPTTAVTVTITPDGQLSVAPGSVTFTPDDWDTPRTVTVTAVADGVGEGAHVGTVAHAAASADPVYNGVAVAGLTAQVSDPPPVPRFPLAFGGTGGDVGSGLAVDAAGNVYVAGEFEGTVDFDSGTGTTPLTSAGGTDGFVAKYDAAGNLAWVTRVGGPDADYFFTLAVDPSGNVYAAGSTTSTGLATAGAAQTTFAGGSADGLVVKLTPGGAVVYATYLGGGMHDDVRDVAVDAAGSVYLTGSSSSADFPTANAAQGTFGGGSVDVVAARLNPAGSALVFSTYLGRVGNDLGSAIALDAAGNAYVAGYTRSSNFPVTSGAYQTSFRGSADGIVVKFSPTGAVVYSTFLGGNDPLGEGLDDITVDGAGRAHVVGGGGSPDYPLMNPVPGTSGSTYVSTLSADGSALLFSTTLGADGGARGIAVDAAGALYVTGSSTGGNLAATDGSVIAGGSDAFLVKLLPGAAGGARIGYAGYLGGAGTDHGQEIAVDADRNVTLLASFRGTADFEFGTGTAFRTSQGGDDVAVVRVSGANRAPAAVADTAIATRGAAVTVNVLVNDADPDGDPLTLSVVAAPDHGTAVVDNRGTPADPTDDVIVYTPAAG
ncbi:MAG TPA: SBBP repeat-containing protein, partial [Urbifossiella sp.]|nr:SBBP repeat-containing protein [Urbifossiella sp.]